MHCLIPQCRNGAGRCKAKILGMSVMVHCLPKDKKMLDKWVKISGRKEIKMKTASICSTHFLPSDYRRDLMFELANPGKGVLDNPRRRLKADAVPSQNLSRCDDKNCTHLEEAAGAGDGAAATDSTLMTPLDLAKRAAIVQEAIADLEERQQEERVHGPQHLTFQKFAGTKRRRRASDEEDLPGAADLSDAEPVDADDGPTVSAGGLDRQLKVMSQLQRRTRVLERKLAEKRRQLKEVLEQRDFSLVTLAGGDRKRADGGGPAAPTADQKEAETGGGTLVVLRSEQDRPFGDLPPANDLLTLPVDLTEAKRVIFNLRLEVMALRNRVLKHAHHTTALRIEMIEKDMERDAKHAAVVKRLRDALDVVFTSSQQSHLVPGRRTVAWGLQDYLRAISLRWLCRRSTFEYVRNTMKIPLPSMFSVRSMAACGLLPEVTKRYKELSEHKKLRFTRLPVEKPEQSDSDATEGPDPADSEIPKRRGRGGGAGRGKKRKAAPEEESEPGPPSPRKPCWDAVDLTERDDVSSGGDEAAWSNYVRASLGVTRSPRGRGRGRGRQRAGRTGPKGKREPGPAGGVQFAQEVRGYQLERTAPADDVQTVSRGWADCGRPPSEGQKPLPGLSSVKREVIQGRGKSSPRSRGARARVHFSDRHEFG